MIPKSMSSTPIGDGDPFSDTIMRKSKGMRYALAAVFVVALTGSAIAQVPQQQFPNAVTNPPVQMTQPQQLQPFPQQQQQQQLQQIPQQQAAPRQLDSFGDKTTRCMNYGAGAGVPADQIGQYSRECAQSQ